MRRGELCSLQIRDIDLGRGLVHVAFNYVVRGGQRVRKDTKTHQDRSLGPGSGAGAPVRKAKPSYRFNVLRTGAACPMAATLAALRHHT